MLRRLPAAMNEQGVNALILFASNPDQLSGPVDMGDQRYLPGISVPGVAGLETPFNVPLMGDNEPVSICIDTPRRADVGYWKRLTLIGTLVAESVTTGVPLNRDLGPDEDDTVEEAPEIDEALDQYTGEWGGFLRAVVMRADPLETELEGQSVDTGTAEFIVMESKSDFDRVQRMLHTVSAAEIVTAVMAPELFSQVGPRPPVPDVWDHIHGHDPGK